MARTKECGFSLVELLGVLVVLGLIAGVAAVSWYSSLPRAQLNTCVRELSDHVHGARADAIARNLEYRIYYNLDEDTYWVETPFSIEGGIARGDDEKLTVSHTSLPDTVSFYETTIDGESYSDGIVFVRFDPLGASSDHTIVLYQDLFERYYTMEVLALTGLVRFHDDFFERDAPDEGDFN